MAITKQKQDQPIYIGVGRVRAFATPRFDWIVLILSAWLSGGAYLDGWAHNHVPDLETFFTPWHAVFYSGFGAVGSFIVGSIVWNHLRGRQWARAVPVGYELSLLGVIVFAVAGVGDLIWHTLFGIEENIEALLSPTHLCLALGVGLIATGPLRSAWHRTDPRAQSLSLPRLAPALVSLALLVAVLMFMTQFAHPWASPVPAERFRPTQQALGFYIETIAVAAFLLQTALLMGPLLLAMLRWSLPLGSFTLVIGIDAIMMALMRDQFQLLPAIIGAGVAADVLNWTLQPSARRTTQLRLFAFSVPVLLWGLYFLTLMVTGGVWWSIHMWAGSIAMAGVAGWLLSYLASPPRVPLAQTRSDGQ